MLPPVNVIVDTREPKAMLILLENMGVEVDRRVVTPGDYIVSEECGIERKTVNDFVNSLFKGRLMEQLVRLKETYARPMLLLEGNTRAELSNRKNPRVFWGALLKIELDLMIPTIVTMDMRQSADAIYTLARRLQKKSEEEIRCRYKPKTLTESDLQIFILSGLPNIGDELGRRLLSHFKTLRNVFNASCRELMAVQGIGPLRARKIAKILDIAFEE